MSGRTLKGHHMTLNEIFKKNVLLKKYYRQLFIIIGIVWALFDFSRFLTLSASESTGDYPFSNASGVVKILRLGLSFLAYGFFAFLVVMWLRNKLRRLPLWLNFIIKAMFLSLMSILFVTFFFVFINTIIYNRNIFTVGKELIYYITDTNWLVNHTLTRLLLFIITLLVLELNEKYSPGVFSDVFFGKYLNPKEEKRIIMFIDLKDSTPIAEKLGHIKYFSFIRDFIQDISLALLEYDGLIYQYVGDEIVVSWLSSEKNKQKSFQSLIRARSIIQKESNNYRREYGVTPEFRVGAHVGLVTVGEIGVVKKDLAMSGDAMNTTARIRSMASEVNQNFLVSSDFVETAGLNKWQVQSMGYIDLKGKQSSMELFALKI